MAKSIQSSPVLSALNFRVRALRGRFYYERSFSDDEFFVMGRVTPLATPENYLLLEFEHSKGNWQEVAEGEIKTIIHAISSDKEGTFHGLGALDKSIQLAETEGTDRLKIIQDEYDDTSFSYAEGNQKCGVQEVLYHYFDVPIPVIAEPRDWYIYHRTPSIREVSANNEQILVDFTASDMYGDDFGGTCLYIKKEQQWDVFTIKPNQSGSIESALAWLEKRKWKEW